MNSAREWAERLADGPTLAIGAIKLGMARAQHGTFRDALHWEAMMLSREESILQIIKVVSAMVMEMRPMISLVEPFQVMT